MVASVTGKEYPPQQLWVTKVVDKEWATLSPTEVEYHLDLLSLEGWSLICVISPTRAVFRQPIRGRQSW